MRKIKAVLRPKLDAGLSHQKTACALGDWHADGLSQYPNNLLIAISSLLHDALRLDAPLS